MRLSESSKNKTKRGIITLMSDYEWSYQYSLFPALEGGSKEEDKIKAEELILSGLDLFREKLRKKFQGVGILFMLRRGRISEGFRVNYRKDFQQLYLTWYSASKMDKNVITDVLKDCYDFKINVCSQSLTQQEIESSVSAIRNQKLHDLSLYYEIAGKKFKRFTVINRKYLIEKFHTCSVN